MTSRTGGSTDAAAFSRTNLLCLAQPLPYRRLPPRNTEVRAGSLAVIMDPNSSFGLCGHSKSLSKPYMTGSIVFVHGTGVRLKAYTSAFADAQAAAEAAGIQHKLIEEAPRRRHLVLGVFVRPCRRGSQNITIAHSGRAAKISTTWSNTIR